jgi:uracil-DNA glycosylase
MTSIMDKQKVLKKLRDKLAKLDHPLKETASNLVFGDGNPESKIYFMGEAPGKNEDLRGKPFVGAAGRILDSLLESVGLTKKDVFINSVLPYRPPNNRPPKQAEIEFFEPFLDEQIEIIAPKIIVTLGKYSLEKFLPGEKISQVHGEPKEVKWKGKKLTILPMYHPAASFHSTAVANALKEDFLKNKRLLKR